MTNPPLENSRQEDSHWRETLVKQVQHSELELIANFVDIPMRLSKVLKLQPGDVLPIDKPERLIAHVDGVPVLTSQYGTLNGQYALRVEHLINPILNALSEEQPTSDPKQPSGEGKESVDDLWADAFNEQQSTEKSGASTEGVFKSLEAQDALGSLQDIDLILDIPVKLTVELGRTKMTIKELLRLSQGSVVALDGLAGEPLDILINGYLIAQGEVVVVADKFGVRITDIITPSERMRRLSR